jgi:hypothetical protein
MCRWHPQTVKRVIEAHAGYSLSCAGDGALNRWIGDDNSARVIPSLGRVVGILDRWRRT